MTATQTETTQELTGTDFVDFNNKKCVIAYKTKNNQSSSTFMCPDSDDIIGEGFSKSEISILQLIIMLN